MPHSESVQHRIAALNARYKHHSATAVLEHALQDTQVGKTAMVSSFGAESVVLLHLVSVIDRSTPVLFIDTQMLFPETLAYQQELTERLNLKDVRVIRKVTLRGDRMYEFLDRLITAALPRVRDFQGIKVSGFDGRGNYNLGVTEQIIFPEINIDKVNKISGMDITFVTSTDDDKLAQSLLKELGLPFKKN